MRRGICGIVVALLSGCLVVGVGAQPSTAMDSARALQTFDRVAESIEQLYFDTALKGLDWPALVANYRAQLSAQSNQDALHAHINRLLATLNDSHTRLLTPREMQTQSVATVSASERGLRLGEASGQIFVREIVPNSPARRSGLALGDIVLHVNDDNASTRFQTAFDALSTLPVVARRREAALARVLAAGGEGVWSLHIQRLGAAPQRIMVSHDEAPLPATARMDMATLDVARLSLRRFSADALVASAAFFDQSEPRGYLIDVRGNEGGDLAVAMSVAERLFAEPVTMAVEQARDRNGGPTREKRWPIGGKPGARAEPVALLIDERCASACEVFVSALKENQRARVFGHASAGVVAGIPTKPIVLPDGSGLNVSRLGILSPRGSALDNVGVAPDTSCVITPEQLARGEDCVLNAALKWLGAQIAY